MAEAPLVIAVVDDHELIQTALHAIADAHPTRLVVTGLDQVTATPATPATPTGPTHNPTGTDTGISTGTVIDVVLVDPSGPDGWNQTDVAGLVQDPRVARVVVFSWTVDHELLERGRRLGVDGFVSKTLPAATLVETLEQLRRSRRADRPPTACTPTTSHLTVTTVTTAATAALVPSIIESAGTRRLPPVHDGRGARLSDRESDVLALIASGHSNAEIAAALQLTANTVKSYIRSLYRKLGVTTRTQAVTRTLRPRPHPPLGQPRAGVGE